VRRPGLRVQDGGGEPLGLRLAAPDGSSVHQVLSLVALDSLVVGLTVAQRDLPGRKPSVARAKDLSVEVDVPADRHGLRSGSLAPRTGVLESMQRRNRCRGHRRSPSLPRAAEVRARRAVPPSSRILYTLSNLP
jgi:hypothetical protein